jgi:cob(I)alamin adenosyltransferase
MKSKDNSKIKLNKIYTRTGDGGQTRLVGGQILSKDNIRIESYGMVDELNSFLGLCRESSQSLIIDFPKIKVISDNILKFQNQLFVLGSLLATLPKDIHPQMTRITKEDIETIEKLIDEVNEYLTPLKSFVLPGGSELNARLHVARSICRRVERKVVMLSHVEEIDKFIITYLNRLSDLLFVWSRWANKLMNVDEVIWENH